MIEIRIDTAPAGNLPLFPVHVNHFVQPPFQGEQVKIFDTVTDAVLDGTIHHISSSGRVIFIALGSQTVQNFTPKCYVSFYVAPGVSDICNQPLGHDGPHKCSFGEL